MRGRGSRGKGDKRRRDVPMAEEGQEYARVMAMLGNGRVRAKFADNSERVCRIRGSMRKREWIGVGDVVLVAARDGLAGDTADIVHRYLPAEVLKLKAWGEPVVIAADEQEAELDEYVCFEPADEDEIELDLV